ncbi:VOC family protein [Naasia sp. SYSU D00057]|uniref:VOC family protein n=1 Tax=Naasia sp. SYSU D00057 TaxID=2817380 RepID=UPI001B313AB1|nr:VOC family protein [Naasia sp. SYSU D00057]
MSGRITPCLWFATDLEEVIAYYSGIFPDARPLQSQSAPEGTPGGGGGTLVAELELGGQRLMLLAGRPDIPFTEAVSLVVDAETQQDIDRLWDALTADGGEPGQCGWLKDRYGLSWQVVPPRLPQLLADPDPAVAGRVMQAMLQMTKIDLAAVEAAARG